MKRPVNKSEKTDPIRFSPEQNKLIQEGLEASESGDLFTPEEAHELARNRTKAWLNPDQKNSA